MLTNPFSDDDYCGQLNDAERETPNDIDDDFGDVVNGYGNVDIVDDGGDDLCGWGDDAEMELPYMGIHWDDNEDNGGDDDDTDDADDKSDDDDECDGW